MIAKKCVASLTAFFGCHFFIHAPFAIVFGENCHQVNIQLQFEHVRTEQLTEHQARVHYTRVLIVFDQNKTRPESSLFHSFYLSNKY
jgi:hypothetical protein